MNRTDALTVATQKYNAYQAAYIQHLFRGAPAPVEADFNYLHGWIVGVAGFNFSGEEIAGPCNQPYMD